ncbi:OmpA family protein [Aquimarina algicola]|uniref:OmpA family protein n=1 Tax=Aquimarina algicola TaxID=2589995 RepID=A0A504JBY0_9FLAO|nr:OmpA family protein [Aquimarina algicola]TPN85378.1 OmpA family protein [Aquimarina algicola]
MKTTKTLCILISLFWITTSNAQLLERLGKRVEDAAKRTVERRVERETEDKTNRGLDGIFNKKRKKKKGKKKTKDNTPIIGSGEYNINRAPDFATGTIIIFQDNFTKDAQGDFPAKWDTNGSGEIVIINNEKWFRLGGNSKYIPSVKETLPENYTIEFDLLTQGLDKKTSSQAWIKLLLEENTSFQTPKNWCVVELSPCQFIESRGVVEKVVDGQRQIRNEIGKDYRSQINGKSHIAIAVNKTRMRVWMNENKIVDVPRLVPQKATVFKIHTKGLRDAIDKDEVYISNFKIAKSGTDNRSKLITEGRLSTNAILFKTGSADIIGGAENIIKEVATALKEVPDVNIKIIGHTDADGSVEKNKTLSEQRAKAVKMMLVEQHDIRFSRIITEGKGETSPIADNSSPQGKAKNRRVEFIKL